MWLILGSGYNDHWDSARVDKGMALKAGCVVLLCADNSRSGTEGCVLSVGVIKSSVLLRCKDGGGNSVRGKEGARNKIHEG